MFHFVVPVELDSSDADSPLLLLRHFCRGETQKIAVCRLQDDILAVIYHLHAYQLVPVLELRGRNRTLGNLEFHAVHLLDHPGLRHEQQPGNLHLLRIAQIDYRLLRAVIIAHIIDRQAFVPEFAVRQVQHFYLVHPACVGKDADLPCIHAGEHIPVLCIGRVFIPLIYRIVYGLCIAKAVHKEHDFLLFYLLFFKYRRRGIFDCRAPGPPIFFLDSVQIFHDDF